MNPISWLTGKVALWVCIALLSVIATQSVTLWYRGNRLEAARVERDKWHGVANTWKKTADTYKGASEKWRAATRRVGGLLEAAVKENERVATDNAAAVAKAQAERADAERTLKLFTERFASRTPTCAQALKQMEASCPELQHY